MVRDDLQRCVGGRAIGRRSVFDIQHLRGTIDDGAQEIGFEVAQLSLEHTRNPLKSRTGVDGGLREWRQMAFLVAIELHEDEIPQLDVTSAFAGKAAIGMTQFAGAGPEIVVNLRARATGPGVPHLPEVVFLVEAYDTLAGDSGLRCPEIFRLVILAKDRHPEAVCRKLVLLGEQFPGKLDGVFLEIVTERKIAQHFKECLVTPRVSHIVEIVVLAAGPDDLLTGCRTVVVPHFAAQEDFIKLVHPSVHKEQGGVFSRY